MAECQGTGLDPAAYGSLMRPLRDDDHDPPHPQVGIIGPFSGNKKPARSWLSRSAVATVLVGACVLVGWWGSGHGVASSSSSSSAGLVVQGVGVIRSRLALVEQTLDLTIEVGNKYGYHVAKDSLYPWLNGKKLLEPYMETSLTIQGFKDEEVGVEMEQDKDLHYDWAIYEMTPDGGAKLVGEYEGKSVLMAEAPGVGLYTIQVTVTDGEKHMVGVHKEVAYSRYVRRELRELTREDRDAFFDAAYIMWNTTTKEGQPFYGESYYGIDDFVAYHLEQAGARDCDHMHDGLGFFTQHTALSIKFERSLQAVNPVVSLPYWDFTIESELITNDFDSDFSGQWFETEVFNDDMFGRVDPVSHTVTSGRWADVEMMEAAEGSVSNAYGLMRAPWNQNKDKRLTRIASFCGDTYDNDILIFPNCELHYNAVSEYNTFESFAWMLPYAPHGPVHVLTGGTYNCDAAYGTLDDVGYVSDVFRASMAHRSYLTIKALWRGYLMECPTDCSEDTPQEECLCYCPDLEDAIAQGDVSAYLDATLDTLFLDAVMELPFEDQVTVASAFCNAGLLEGDQLEAASPFDPSFWPIHPTIERLWVYKKLLNYFDSEEWPSTGVSVSGDDCEGHRSTDVIEMTVFDEVTYSTNAELYEMMDPQKDALPYVFDHFSWNHCLEYGVDFSLTVKGEGLGSTASGSGGGMVSPDGGGSTSSTTKRTTTRRRRRKGRRQRKDVKQAIALSAHMKKRQTHS